MFCGIAFLGVLRYILSMSFVLLVDCIQKNCWVELRMKYCWSV